MKPLNQFLCLLLLLWLTGIASCRPVSEPDRIIIPGSPVVPDPTIEPARTEYTLLVSHYGYAGNQLVPVSSTALVPGAPPYDDPYMNRNYSERKFHGGGAIAIDSVKKMVYWMSTMRFPRDQMKQDKIKVYDYKNSQFLPDLPIGSSTDPIRIYDLYYDLSISTNRKFLYAVHGLIDYGKSRQFELLKIDLESRSINQRLPLNEGVGFVSQNPINGRLYLAGNQAIMSTDANFATLIEAYTLPAEATINSIRCSSDGALWALVSLYKRVDTGGFTFDKGLLLQLSVNQRGKLDAITSQELPQSIFHHLPPHLPFYTPSIPNSLAFGPDNSIYVGTAPNGKVFRYDRKTNQFNPNAYYAHNNDVSGSIRREIGIAGLAIVSGEFR